MTRRPSRRPGCRVLVRRPEPAQLRLDRRDGGGFRSQLPVQRDRADQDARADILDRLPELGRHGRCHLVRVGHYPADRRPEVVRPVHVAPRVATGWIWAKLCACSATRMPATWGARSMEVRTARSPGLAGGRNDAECCQVVLAVADYRSARPSRPPRRDGALARMLQSRCHRSAWLRRCLDGHRPRPLSEAPANVRPCRARRSDFANKVARPALPRGREGNSCPGPESSLRYCLSSWLPAARLGWRWHSRSAP